MPVLALKPTTLNIRSIGTEPQRRGLMCWFCMALVLTERQQGVTCAWHDGRLIRPPGGRLSGTSSSLSTDPLF